MPVECLCDELEEREDTSGANAGEGVGGAREEKVEQAEADGVALAV